MNYKCCNDGQQKDCCAQGECCSTPTSSSTNGQSGGGRWKTAIFIIVMVMVTGLMIYSILTHKTDTAVMPSPEVSAAPAVPFVPTDALSTTGSRKLTPVESLDEVFAHDYDFVLVVLSGSDDNLNMEVSRYVAQAAAKIQAQDIITVGTFTMSTNNPKSIDTSVLLSSKYGAKLKYGNKYLVTDEITETKLLQAYLGFCNGSSSSCCPTSTSSSSSSCCP